MARRKPDPRTPLINYDLSPQAGSQSNTDAALNPELTEPEIPLKHSSSFWGWQLLWLSVILVFGLTGGSALLWLLTTPPPPNCQQISPLAADGERLYCAQKAAESGDLEQLLAAIQLGESWPPDHPMYSQAQQLIGEWSKAILFLATRKMEAGDLQGAEAIVNRIPKTSPAYTLVSGDLKTWQKNWDEGQIAYDRAEEAIKAQDWRRASDLAQALSKLDNPHWKEKRYKELLEQIALEKQGGQRLQEAKRLAEKGTTTDLGEAITLAQTIDSKLYAYEKAQKEVIRWSRALLNIASQRLQEKDLNGMLQAASFIPSATEFYREAQDMIQLGRAQVVVDNQSANTSLLQDILTLVEGQAAVAQITPERPLYAKAQNLVKTLDGQIQDLVQLQWASAVASWGQPFLLQLAIDQAKMVGPERPRRLHAQTLVTQWQQELLRLEDQPYLAIARQSAESKTVSGYKSAIEQARQIAIGRPLRVQAQTWIAHWSKQVQVVEDQPLLDEARRLAKQGKLDAAVALLSKIEKGRALYAEAKAERDKWVTDLQIAEDKPILDEANSLAVKGQLTAAINTASQIGYGRALYPEAQGVIAQWSAERDAAWARSQPVEAARPASTQPDPYTAPPEEAYYSPSQPSEPTYSEPAPQPALAPPPAETYVPPPEVPPVESVPVQEVPPSEPAPPAVTSESGTPAAPQDTNLLQE